MNKHITRRNFVAAAGLSALASPSLLAAAEAPQILIKRGAKPVVIAAANGNMSKDADGLTCVAKTFPDYFEALFSVAQTPDQAIPVICVDGPTASGKGTLAVVLAQKLGYHFLDSGSLYRITALAALRAGLGLDSTSEAEIAQMVKRLHIQFTNGRVLLNGDDVSDTIRTESLRSWSNSRASHPPGDRSKPQLTSEPPRIHAAGKRGSVLI